MKALFVVNNQVHTFSGSMRTVVAQCEILLRFRPVTRFAVCIPRVDGFPVWVSIWFRPPFGFSSVKLFRANDGDLTCEALLDELRSVVCKSHSYEWVDTHRFYHPASHGGVGTEM